MKKAAKKLQLSRDTMLYLDPEARQLRVAGGFVTATPFCSAHGICTATCGVPCT